MKSDDDTKIWEGQRKWKFWNRKRDRMKWEKKEENLNK